MRELGLPEKEKFLKSIFWVVKNNLALRVGKGEESLICLGIFTLIYPKDQLSAKDQQMINGRRKREREEKNFF